MRKRVFTAVGLTVALALGVLGLAGPATASQISYSSKLTPGAPIGLLVHFKQGFNANGWFGALSGQQALTTVGIPVGSQRALGQGWHVLNFRGAVSASAAAQAQALMSHQPGVTSVAINTFIAARPAAVARASSRITPVGFPALTFKPASQVLKVTATDAWSAMNPSEAQVAVGWASPKSLFGFKLTGFKLQASLDSGVSFLDVPGAYASKVRSALISSGLTVGQTVMVRVAAITSNGKATKQGAWSALATTVPTALPIAPNLITSSVSSSVPKASWTGLQSAQETGGLPITYTAVATAAGQADVSCTSATTSCTFTGLVSGVNYQVKVRAENKHGAGPWAAGFKITDPLYSLQWYLNSTEGINVEGAWAKTRGSASVTVAVIDSGITEHPDLDGQLWRNIDNSVYGYDFVSTASGSDDGDGWDANPTDTTPSNEWHGTHVSGLIAAANNNIGVIGVASGVKLLEVRALGSKGGSPADLIAALNWAAGKEVPGVPKNLHPAQVINMSLGNPQVAPCDTATASVLQTLHDMNIMV
ncbi:MAG: S8 family serine peptidase, partial [Actinomycetales bacterium]|nr:S8 family serine peptidase [Actinomycetales bacterium]